MIVVTIGASLSGLYASLCLAKGGHKVLVLEKGEGPLPPRRLIVTKALKEEFPSLTQRVLYAVKAYRFIGHRAHVVIPLREPDLVVERRDLSEALLLGCRALGVEVLWGHEGVGIGDGGVLFRGAKGGDVLKANWIIASDGALSQLRKALGERLPLVYLRQARVRRPRDWEDGVSGIWFRPDLTPYFLWFFQDSPDTGVLGLISSTKGDGERALEAFLEEGPWEVSGFEEGWVSLYDPALRPDHGGVHFLGDAAGQVKNSTVGGVLSGLRAAEACARALLKGRDYPKELRPLARELLVHYLVRRILEGFGPEQYDRLISELRGRPLGSVSRDRLFCDLPLFLLRNPRFTSRLFPKAVAKTLGLLRDLTRRRHQGNK